MPAALMPIPWHVTQLSFTGIDRPGPFSEDFDAPQDRKAYGWQPIDTDKEHDGQRLDTRVALYCPMFYVKIFDRFQLDYQLYEVIRIRRYDNGLPGFTPGQVIDLRLVVQVADDSLSS